MDSADQKQIFPLTDLIRNVVLCSAMGFLVFSVFGSAEELATLSYNFKYNFHVPMLSLQVSEADRSWTWIRAENLTDNARTLTIAKSMIEHGVNGAMAGSAFGFALFASQWNARKRNESGFFSTNQPLFFVLTLGLLVSTGFYVYLFRSDYVVLTMTAQTLSECLLFLVSAMPPFLLVGSLLFFIRKWLPGKFDVGHRIEAVPWMITLGTLVWGVYWGCSPSSEMPRPLSEGWIAIPILLSFPINWVAWMLMLCRRRGERAKLLLLGTAHMVFQIPVAFMCAMMAMGDGM